MTPDPVFPISFLPKGPPHTQRYIGGSKTVEKNLGRIIRGGRIIETVSTSRLRSEFPERRDLADTVPEASLQRWCNEVWKSFMR